MDNLLKDIIFAFWFFAPAGLANVVAFASGKITFLRPFNYPVDFNLRVNNKRILGSHKTIRGFLLGTLVAIGGVYFQVFLYNQFMWMREILSFNYTLTNPILLGFLLGFGALAGDAVKSFFKRQRGLQPGRSWVPFDQIDFILGGIFLTWFYVQLTLFQYFLIFLIWIIIHPAVAFVGYLLKLRRKPL